MAAPAAPAVTTLTRCLIGGEWRPSSDGSTFAVTDPATGEAIADVADATVADARAAVDAAAAAAPGWAGVAPRERAEILRRCFEMMTDQAHELADLIVAENGKSRADALGEVAYAAEFFRWFGEEAVRIRGEVGEAPGGGRQILTMLQPVGVALLVTPWNFPAAMATRKLAPALAAGCTTVLKPAPETPLTALAVADILARCGVPDGVVNVLPTTRAPQTVAAMMADERVRKLSFTGSTEVGSVLLHQAADRVVNTSMELGGNGPFIVFDDADLDLAVEAALIAKMRNGGESCIAANRFLVHRDVLDAFTDRLVQSMAALRLGPGTDPDAEVGPVISRQAQQRIHALVRSAVAGGATVLTGGDDVDGPGSYVRPTVLTGLSPDDPLLHTEVFGPVATVLPFDTEAEAVAAANDTPHGLAGYVITADLARAMRVAEQMEVGMVGINRGLISDPAAPFGGVKGSGLGREGARDGLLAFLETKYIAIAWEG